MIQNVSGVDSIARTPSQNSLVVVERKALPEPDFCSVIRGGRRGTHPLVTRLSRIALKIWEWIKYNLLFLLFDVEEERLETLKTEIGDFVEMYFDHESVPSPSRAREITKAYRGLDPEIKEEIESAIASILYEAKEDLSAKKIQFLIRKIIKHPFCTIDDPTKPPADRKVHVMSRAILQVSTKFAGYTTE